MNKEKYFLKIRMLTTRKDHIESSIRRLESFKCIHPETNTVYAEHEMTLEHFIMACKNCGINKDEL